MSIAFVVLVLFMVGVAIKKNYNTQIVLILGGMAMFLYAYFANVGTVVDLKSNVSFYMVDKLKAIFSSRFAELGLIIMASGGFATYMKHIGAIDALVSVSFKPLQLFKNPYVLGAVLCITGNILQMFITSATGLAILLMSVAFPILCRAKLPVASAAAFVVMTGVSEFGPTQTNAIFAATQANVNIIEYVVGYQVYVVGLGLPLAMLVAGLWFSYLDKKEGNKEATEAVEEKVVVANVPKWYAILPMIPVMLLIVFSKYTGSTYAMHLITATLIAVFVSMAIDCIRRLEFKSVISGYDKFLDGMAVLVPVVGLIVAAQFFAEGLLSTKAVAIMLDSMKDSGLSAIWAMVALVLLVMVTTLITGSGNASFLSLGHLAPGIATHMGVNAIGLVLPMQITASVARGMSPIAGVVIAVAGIAKVHPLALVKRTMVPMLVYIVFASIVGTMFI